MKRIYTFRINRMYTTDKGIEVVYFLRGQRKIYLINGVANIQQIDGAFKATTRRKWLFLTTFKEYDCENAVMDAYFHEDELHVLSIKQTADKDAA
ncbi:MAG: hypothetical protein OYH77_01960 [Pseudomonadota bacterium]|nr:hypothetical protein [Pseudomonadota bacterium]